MQTVQGLLVGCESTPIWKQSLGSGDVPQLVSLELTSLAEWLSLFVWAALCSKMVVWLLELSCFTSGQLGLLSACGHGDVLSEFLFCFPLVSPLEVDVI